MEMQPIANLNLAKVYTVDSYKDEFGSLPPFDSKLKTKRWITPVGLAVPYTFFDRTTRTFQKWTKGLETTRVNIPQPIIYGEYNIIPTRAIFSDPLGTPVNPIMLSSLEEAIKLSDEIGLADPIENTFSSYPIIWNDEKRRIWNIASFNAGLLLKRRYSHGFNRPGLWEFQDNGQPIWKPDPIPEIDITVPEIPVPCRELRNNERLVNTPMGSFFEKFEIEDTELEKGEYEEILERLNEIYSILLMK